MVGRCSVCVCNQDGGNITEITNDKKQTFVCDFAGYFPNYRLVYPHLSKDGFIKIQKSELKAVAGFVKEIAKRNKKAVFHFVLLPEIIKFIYLIMMQTVTDTKNFVQHWKSRFN